MKNLVASVSNLLKLVPRPPEAAIPVGATEAEIGAFEALVGFEVPMELKEWLRVSNGPCVGPGGLFGIASAPKHLLIANHLLQHPEWKANGWLPIAGDGCGNYYMLVTAQEFGPGFPVIFVEPLIDVSLPAYLVASNIWNFLEFILMKELSKSSWPFNGVEVIAQDPGILAFSGVQLPWEA